MNTNNEEGKYCPVCGEYHYKESLCCSPACTEKYQQNKKICKFCGKEFYSGKKCKFYCSDRCRLDRINRDTKANKAKKAANPCLLIVS